MSGPLIRVDDRPAPFVKIETECADGPFTGHRVHVEVQRAAAFFLHLEADGLCCVYGPAGMDASGSGRVMLVCVAGPGPVLPPDAPQYRVWIDQRPETGWTPYFEPLAELYLKAVHDGHGRVPVAVETKTEKDGHCWLLAPEIELLLKRKTLCLKQP